jgi:hypothetical protein
MREEAKDNPRKRNSDTDSPDAGSSDISSDMKHRTVEDRDDSLSHSSRRDNDGFNGCCTAMWKATGKIATLVLFLDSLSKIRCNGKQLLDDLKGSKKILEVEAGSSGSHSLENSVWKRLWTCRKTDYYLRTFEHCSRNVVGNFEYP